MANGTIHKFGTLKVNGTLYAMPSNPVNGGNCVSYNGTAISIENTTAGKELQWIELNKADGTQLLVCDRCLVVGISWNNLNDASLITGKTVTIDGKKYKLRSLTGSNGQSSGKGANNEWDYLLDKVGESNDITHWSNMYTWCQETWYNNASCRSVRGYNSARNCNYLDATYTYTYFGFRPVLEVLNAAPDITPNSSDYGDKAGAFSISYSVSDKDGDKFDISVKLDNTEIEKKTNQSDGTYTLDLSSHWGSLSKAKHTVTITATDTNGEATTKTYTFTKTNSAPDKPTISNPTNGQRIAQSGYVYFSPASDPDGDTQSIVLEVSSSSSFSNKKTFSGTEVYKDGSWTKIAQITNANAGGNIRIPFTGLAENSDIYMRIASTDSGSGTPTYSTAIKIATGGELHITTKPYNYDTMPTNITLAIASTIDPRAEKTIRVCNNANDEEPTWEDYVPQNGIHRFTNQTKTADDWAVATEITVKAADATGAIEISAICEGVC